MMSSPSETRERPAARPQAAPVRAAFFHITAGNFSGAAKNIVRLFRRLDRSRLSPILVVQAENELTRRVRELGIEVRVLPFPPGLAVYDGGLLRLNPFVWLRAIKGAWDYNRVLLRFFREVRPDVVWADNIRTFCTLYPAVRLSGPRLIWNLWSEPEGKTAWILHRVGLVLADAVNPEYRGQALKLFGRLAGPFRNKIMVLYTGVTDFEEASGRDVRAELGLKSSDVVLLMAGNISPAKGQLDLAAAMELLAEEFPRLHLLLAGRPLETHPASVAYHARLQQLASSGRLSGRVHLLGWRSDAPDLLAAADVYVSSSYSESLPDAVRDAMRAGKPVVASDVGGTAELIVPGREGFLFKPGDIRALADRVARLARDPVLRGAMGARGRRLIEENFSTELYARRFEEMAEAVAGREGNAHG